MLAQLKRWLSRQSPATVPDAQWRQVEHTLPCLTHLRHDERLALRDMALDFLQRKVFAGAQGFEPDNFVRLSIALQASLLVLKLGLHAYDGWRGIIVYPGEFLIPQRVTDRAGVTHEFKQQALGQAWEAGPVVLAWHTPSDLDSRTNVVIHEFAHKLDMLSGHANGAPPLPADIRHRDWHRILNVAYADFCRQVESGAATFLNAYAAENPAEFFAMCCEAFFCDPVELDRYYPNVYGLLSRYFQQDPLVAWQHAEY